MFYKNVINLCDTRFPQPRVERKLSPQVCCWFFLFFLTPFSGFGFFGWRSCVASAKSFSITSIFISLMMLRTRSSKISTFLKFFEDNMIKYLFHVEIFSGAAIMMGHIKIVHQFIDFFGFVVEVPFLFFFRVQIKFIPHKNFFGVDSTFLLLLVFINMFDVFFQLKKSTN